MSEGREKASQAQTIRSTVQNPNFSGRTEVYIPILRKTALSVLAAQLAAMGRRTGTKKRYSDYMGTRNASLIAIES